MNTQTVAAPLTPRLHPLMATAAIAVTTFSLAGIAAMTGLLPMSQAGMPSVTAPMAAPVAATAEPVIAVPPAPTSRASAPRISEKRPTGQAVKPAAQATDVSTATPLETRLPQALPATSEQAAGSQPPCLQCGVIDNVREVAQPGEGSGLGAVIGGVAGGLLGSQIGGGNGQKLAAVLGAAGGAYAGHQIEKSRNQTTQYEVSVRMADGSLRTMTQSSLPAWRIGDAVRFENGGLVSAR